MIAINQKKVMAVQKLFEDEIKEQRLDAIEALSKVKSASTQDKSYLNSVKKLFNDHEDLLTQTPEQLETIIAKMDAVPMVKNKKGKFVKSKIKDKILNALDYSGLRDQFYPRYFKELGIKACVYCNSQLAINAVKDMAGTYSAKFDVDHYYPKSNYPFLSISLFNLYPVCAVCNRLKSGNNVIEFDLYSADPQKVKKSSYKFRLTPHSKSIYLTTKDPNSIEFQFIEPVYTTGRKTFNEVFHIKGIYQTQHDIIEELIVKSQIYNTTYIKLLRESFNKLSLSPELFKRTLVGSYILDKDIHKRPMNKFVMDIAKDLGLIDDEIHKTIK